MDEQKALRATVIPRDFSRRRLLQVSAAGLAAGMVAGCTTPASGGQPAQDIPDWTAANIPPQQGRRILITGGNGYPQDGRSGLGYQGALALARAGANVTIASRNQARGEEAVRIIRREVPGAAVRFERLDLADQASVKAFGARMVASGQGLDLLINNAGVMGRRQREVSVDGFERCFATNVLGAFTLTAMLLPLLREGRDPRVTWVASLRGANGKIDFSDLQLDRDYDYVNAYDQTKLAALLLALEFERRNQAAGWGVRSVVSHPGTARTNIVLDGPGPDSQEGFRFRYLSVLFGDPAQRVLPILYAATSPQAAAGGYYGPRDLRGMAGLPGVAPVPDPARDARTAATLWTTLETLAQVRVG